MSQLSFSKKNIYLNVTRTITTNIDFYTPWMLSVVIRNKKWRVSFYRDPHTLGQHFQHDTPVTIPLFDLWPWNPKLHQTNLFHSFEVVLTVLVRLRPIGDVWDPHVFRTNLTHTSQHWELISQSFSTTHTNLATLYRHLTLELHSLWWYTQHLGDIN